MRGERFGSKKSYYIIYSAADDYAVKNFFGNNKEIILDVTKKNAILSVITPTKHEDGSASYCEVAQSGIAAENWEVILKFHPIL